MNKIAIAFLVLILLVLAVLGARAFIQPQAVVDSNALEWAQVHRGDLSEQLAGSGILEPDQEHWLLAKTSGTIVGVRVQPGDQVQADTVLMKLLNSQVEDAYQQALFDLKQAQADLSSVQADCAASLQTARSDLAMAQLDLDAQNKLLKKQVTSRIEGEKARLRVELLQQALNTVKKRNEARLQAAQLKVEQYQARLDALQRKRDHLKLVAGVSGRLFRYEQSFRPGMRLEAGETVARIATSERLRALVRLPSSQGNRLKRGQRVNIHAQGQQLQGEVVRIRPEVKDSEILLEVSLPDQKLQGLKPGQPVRALVETARREHVLQLRVPVGARAGQTMTLYRLQPDGLHLQPVQVALGSLGQGMVEVRSGAQEGDWLVVSDLSRWGEAPLELDRPFER